MSRPVLSKGLAQSWPLSSTQSSSVFSNCGGPIYRQVLSTVSSWQDDCWHLQCRQGCPHQTVQFKLWRLIQTDNFGLVLIPGMDVSEHASDVLTVIHGWSQRQSWYHVDRNVHRQKSTWRTGSPKERPGKYRDRCWPGKRCSFPVSPIAGCALSLVMKRSDWILHLSDVIVGMTEGDSPNLSAPQFDST